MKIYKQEVYYMRHANSKFNERASKLKVIGQQNPNADLTNEFMDLY